MKYLIPAILLLSACSSQQAIEDNPRYAGGRHSQATAGGAYNLIKGEAESGGCGTGMSDQPIYGRLVIDIDTPECKLHLEIGNQQ